MSIVSKMLKQVAVYWPLTGTGNDGQPEWGSPVQLRVRWEDHTTEQATQQGEVQDGATSVYVCALDGTVSFGGGDVVIGGFLMLGELSSTLNPNPRANGARKITAVEKTPDFKARHWVRHVTLGH